MFAQLHVHVHVLYFDYNCREVGDIIENVGGGLPSEDYEEQRYLYITPAYLLKPCIPEQ